MRSHLYNLSLTGVCVDVVCIVDVVASELENIFLLCYEKSVALNL